MPVHLSPIEQLPEDHIACPHCLYSVHGLPAGRCPECGEEFDPQEIARRPVPWEQRADVGIARSIFKTETMLLGKARDLAIWLARPISLAEARRFARLMAGCLCVLIFLLIAVILTAAVNMQRLPGLDAAMIGVAVFAKLITYTSAVLHLPLLLLCHKSEPARERRAAALWYYAAGTGVWMYPLGAALAASSLALGNLPRVPMAVLVAGPAVGLVFWVIPGVRLGRIRQALRGASGWRSLLELLVAIGCIAVFPVLGFLVGAQVLLLQLMVRTLAS